jgi:rRNA pseudouridine-1189 N-methylase Emg1 (Nep1/Mra1 family)
LFFSVDILVEISHVTKVPRNYANLGLFIGNRELHQLYTS